MTEKKPSPKFVVRVGTEDDIKLNKEVSKEPSEVKSIEEDTTRYKAESERLDALTLLEGKKAGFVTTEDYSKAIEQLKKEQADVQSLKQGLDLKNQELEAVNKSQEAKAVFLDARERQIVVQAEEIDKFGNKKAQEVDDKTTAFLTKVLTHFEKGSIGLLEELAWWATQPLVKAAGYVMWHGCDDCRKENARERCFEFDIPKRVSLDRCYDCEQPGMLLNGQDVERVLPHYMCELCPSQYVLDRVKELVVELLLANGIEPKYDVDNQYEKSKQKPKAAKEIIADMVKRLKSKYEEMEVYK